MPAFTPLPSEQLQWELRSFGGDGIRSTSEFFTCILSHTCVAYADVR
jgi:hypothetical protein